MADPREVLQDAGARPLDDLDVEDLRRRVRHRRTRRRARLVLAGLAVLLLPIAAATVFTRGGPDVEFAPLDPPPAHDETVPSPRGSWRSLPPAPIDGRVGAEAVWTGQEFIVWGGLPRADGAAYDPSTDAWRKIADAPLEARHGHAMAWTGEEMIVWGGAAYEPPEDRGAMFQEDGEPRADGAAYDPASDTWRMLAAAPLDARVPGVWSWTGTHLIVAGGAGPFIGDEVFRDGAAYDPRADTWEPIAEMPQELWVVRHSAWADGRLFVFETQYTGAVGAFDPQADAWALQPEPPFPLGLSRGSLVAAWTGSEVLVVSGDLEPAAAALDPATGRWRELSRPPGVERPTGVWTGSELLFAEGFPEHGAPLSVYRLDPEVDGWFALPEGPLAARAAPAMAWTGSELLVWSGGALAAGDEIAVHDDGAAWRPPADDSHNGSG